MIQRIAGPWRRRPVLISSNAAKTLLPQQTDQRMATSLPVRVSASISLATAVKPNASSSSRYAHDPASVFHYLLSPFGRIGQRRRDRKIRRLPLVIRLHRAVKLAEGIHPDLIGQRR